MIDLTAAKEPVKPALAKFGLTLPLINFPMKAFFGG
jgi:hypothetical protein